MYTFKELQDIISDSISDEKIGREPYTLYDPIDYTLSSGGKRIRPGLTLMACNLFSDDITQAIKPAIGLEIFHNFTLLHDDIMDSAEIRRGSSTVHKKWNENTAIISGDAMFMKACTYFLDIKSYYFRDILKIFFNMALKVYEGQQYDMEFEDREKVTEAEYLRMIELKTSVLLAAALQIGALIGGANKDDSKHLYEFGRNIGLAFQLQDDLLDVYGDPGIFGKQIGGDIAANKKTFMLIKAQALAKSDDKEKLKNLLGSENIEKELKIKAVTDIYDKLNIREIVREKIQDLNRKALNSLKQVSVSSDKKSELIKLAEELIKRIS